MEVFRNGKFSHLITGSDLGKGLRSSERAKRNNDRLVECQGAVGRDDVLVVLDELSRMDTSAITDAFPFPQLFVFTRVIIVCSQTKIYEWDGSLTLKLTTTAGSTWRALDFLDWIYMSNGKVSVERDPMTGVYALSDLPVATGMCNYNGQIVIGAPEVEETGY